MGAGCLSLLCWLGGSAPIRLAMLSMSRSTLGSTPRSRASTKGMLWRQEQHGRQAGRCLCGCAGETYYGVEVLLSRQFSHPSLHTQAATHPFYMSCVSTPWLRLPGEGRRVLSSWVRVQYTHHNSSPSTNRMQAKARMLAHTVPYDGDAMSMSYSRAGWPGETFVSSDHPEGNPHQAAVMRARHRWISS